MSQGLFDLTGRVALVTGGSRGLGREMAVALAEAGADVALASRRIQDVRSVGDEIARAFGRRALPLAMDVRDPASVESAVARTLEELGRIDILVNSAGVNVRAPIEDVRDEDWAFVQRTNVAGVMHCCRAVVPHMKRAGHGRIINVGSALGLTGLAGRANYCASKHAVLGLTRALAIELARTGITVNCLCPGPFATDINRALLADPAKTREVLSLVPMNRWGELHEIRAPVVFLASPAASFVTGAALAVDGGWTA